MVEKALKNVAECHLRGERYSAARKVGSGGKNKLIEINSAEMQIIADTMEGGLGLNQSTVLVNVHRSMCDPLRTHCVWGEAPCTVHTSVCTRW
jgi:hypothetical protein